MEGKEAKPRAMQASDNSMLHLEARPSKIFGLAYGSMAILVAPMWKARKPNQEPFKPLAILCWIWKPGLPNSLA